MPLTPGTSLGPYKILALIGAGGMGEVYRARDSRLDRIVAVKVCHERFGERFEREARAIAALNHPHICQIYDVGPDYLVMEYVEGKPVSGPLALSEVLRLSAQMADALDAAHSKGVVHRDLKPDNILVTKSGDIKLLDFGLAKIARPAAAAAPEATATRPLTQQGSIVGTLQYMSPEQLQGLEVGNRSDIFSFGAVFYEMLTGRRAFDAANPASIIAAVLTSEPPSISTLDPLSPPAVERFLRRCLAKDPEARWQSARDLRAALDFVSDGALPSGSLAHSAVHARTSWILAALLAFTAGGLGAYLLRSTHESPRVIRLTLPTESPWRRPVLSPDGSRLAFVSGDTRSSQLWVRPLASFEAQPIGGAEGASEPIWSPDSRQIAMSVQGKLIAFDLAGNRRTICDSSPSVTASWSSSGIIIFSRDNAIYRVSALGGDVTPVTRLDRTRGEIYHSMPYFLPDGRRFLFLAVNQRADDSAIYEGNVDSPQVQRVIANQIGPFYVIGKNLIFVKGSAIFAQPFDWKAGHLKGEPISLPGHVYSDVGSFGPIAAFSATPDTLAYFPARLPPTELVWFDRQGTRLSAVGAIAHYTNPALSPDQKHIAVGVTDPQTNQRDIWLMDALGGGMRLTSHPKDDHSPVWSPDGRRIAFTSDRQGVRDLFIKSVLGNGPEELVLASAEPKAAEAWSPDGKFVIYNGDRMLQAVPVDGEHKPFPVVDCPSSCDQAAVSPDNKWIAYRSRNERRAADVYVQSFPTGGARWHLSTSGGGEPSWRRDGKELYFVRDKELFAVAIRVSQDGIEHSAPKLLFTAPFSVENESSSNPGV
jgi:serine/threonine protein kinase